MSEHEPAGAGLISVEREGRVAIWRIDNPPHNFMNREMVAELDRLVRGLEGERTTGAVVITGAREGLFVTHYDVAEILAGSEGVGMQVAPVIAGASLRTVGGLERLPGAPAALARTPASGLVELRGIHRLFERMNALDKVFVAAIGGPAGGGGCELSLACDIRYMADSAGMIGLPEMTLGFCPGAGGTQRLSRIVGPGRALELMLEGRALSPAEALEAGLVHRVVPGAELVAEATATATRLARRAPLSVAALKHAVYEGASAPLERGLAVERKWFLAACSRPPALRAMRAYVEDLERTGGPAWSDPEAIRSWQEGTRVDLAED